MKIKFVQKVIGSGFVLAFALLSFSCQNAPTSQTQTTVNQEPVKAQTPSDAYRFLYAAVKAKDNAKIEQLMSSNTLTLAGLAMEQQKQSLEKVLENGMTATTFAGNLPEIRDERVNGNFGALEVFNQKDNRWEDLSFVLEDGGWKFAFGDLIKGTYKSPGKGQAQIEMEANNPMGDAMIPSETNANAKISTEKNKSGKIPRVKNGNIQMVEVPIENANTRPAQANKE